MNFDSEKIKWLETVKTRISEIILSLAIRLEEVPTSPDFVVFLANFPHAGANRLSTRINVGYACLKALDAIGNSRSND